MNVIDVEQGSAQWLMARIGKITASRIVDVMARLKNGGESAARRDYRIELVAQRLTGRSESGFVSSEMQWGTEQEPFARAAYEMRNEVMVDQVGFIVHPKFDFSGGSPDGLVGNDGGLEIKAPKTTTHIKWMLAGGVPEEHQVQCLFNMACSGRAWWDFASFDPRLPENLQLFVVRMERDQKRIDEINAEVEKFNTEVETLIASLNKDR